MKSTNHRPGYVLPVIVLAQFAGTSLWFAGNAVLGDLQLHWRLPEDSIGLITSSVQLGFIVGTLVFALSNLADRFAPRHVFFVCVLLGAAANALVTIVAPNLVTLIAIRFAVGFFLAGIYPIGMKLAASWYAEGLGQALGLLVGALVAGTAFPHLLRALGQSLEWREVLWGISAVATVGGALLFAFVPSGPYLPTRSRTDPRAVVRIFRSPDFRAAAFGYFGHMWELYALWASVPVLLASVGERNPALQFNVSLWSFLVIGSGVVGCVAGGFASRRMGSARVAALQIAISATFCLLSPAIWALEPRLVLAILLVWGVVVVGDSPQLSALNAMTAPRELVGTALTLVTSVGFLVTIPSIQLVAWLLHSPAAPYALLTLAPGPLFALFALQRLRRRNA